MKKFLTGIFAAALSLNAVAAFATETQGDDNGKDVSAEVVAAESKDVCKCQEGTKNVASGETQETTHAESETHQAE